MIDFDWIWLDLIGCNLINLLISMSFSDGVVLELCFKLVRANEWKLKVHAFYLMAASTS